jgi:perosamine synthetase
MKRYPRQIGVGGLELTATEKALVNQVLDSNQLTYGPMTKRFEREFALSHGVKYALFMNSGTSALHVALQALKERHGWKDGDEVIVPAVTFVATANIVLHNRMTPVFVDVEADTYNLDPRKIEAKLSPRTRAILPVHLLGLPATMGPILDIAKKHNLKVIEDSCECMFAKYGDQIVGGIGDIGTFSTYVAHFLVTGVGGFATTNNDELANDLRSLMNHGRDTIYISSTDDQNAQGQALDNIVARRFSFLKPGHSFRCTELEAAIGVGQLQRSEWVVARRFEIAMKLKRALEPYVEHLQLPSCPSDRTHTYMLFGICMRNESKVRLVRHLESLNIETRDLLPLINQPVYKELYGELESKYSVAKWVNESGFYIGCHPYMTDEQIGFISDAFADFFKK